MMFLTLKRAAYCGGVNSFHFLLAKLLRMGERALADLLADMLPASCRVAWLMFGRGLTVLAVRRG